MRILITGSSGFIGRYLVLEALGYGYEVWCGVRRSSDLGNLPIDRIHLINLCYDNESALTRQITDHVALHGKWDYVIHNAGVTKSSRRSDFYLVNGEHTRRLLAALELSGSVPLKFLLMSSLSSYGMGDESGGYPIRVEDNQHPVSLYGCSKLQAERYVESSSIPYIILCPTGVYGVGEGDYLLSMRLIGRGLDLVIGFGRQLLTFIYVKDLARLALMSLSSEISNRRYLVSDGCIYTSADFSSTVAKVLKVGRLIRIRVPLFLVWIVCRLSGIYGSLFHRSMTLNSDKYLILRQRNWSCDVSALRRDFGFVPEYDLERGISETLCHYHHPSGSIST